MFEKVVQILEGYTELKGSAIKPDMLLVEDLGLNSVSYFSIVFDLEDAFGIEIPDDAAKNLKTVQDVVNYLEAIS